METGQVVVERFESRVLAGNRPGDPAVRRIPVYLPPSYAREPDRRYPVAYVLSGFTGSGRFLLNPGPWTPGLNERYDARISQGAGEMILVLPDCFTRFGGSQYVNSTALGPYEDHLVEELVPWIDGRYRTRADRAHRGVMGKSSGGYGALVLAMRHPDTFGALVSHSGDLEFDYCYRPDVPDALTQLQNAGGLEAWMRRFESREKKSSDDHKTLNIVAMAAAYSPRPDAKPFGFDLPFDLETGAFCDDVWARWLAHDPLRLLETHADALRGMALVSLDCGTRDEFHLQHGARLFARRLAALGIAHEHEEFDDGHMNIPYRYDVSLPRMARALGA